MESIFIDGSGGSGWIGGLYYKRNVCYALLRNRRIMQKYKLLVMTDLENAKLFLEAGVSQDGIIPCKSGNKLVQMYYWWKCIRKYHIRYIYPLNNQRMAGLFSLIRTKSIMWIPDFQDSVLPEFFDEKELKSRNKNNTAALGKNNLLILSSRVAERDARKYYTVKANVSVMPFVSAIEPELRMLTQSDENMTLQKFGLKHKGYVCVSNQFWQHKDHITVLKALKILANMGSIEGINVVMTGQPNDYRAPDYYEKLINMLQDADIKDHVQILGFLERSEQLAVMKNASYILQPSLFEGWGTVVEDAKVMDKLMLLSDIPLHLEQMDEHAMTFEARNPQDLADKMLLMQAIAHDYREDMQRGLKSMQERAVSYSEAFADLLDL